MEQPKNRYILFGMIAIVLLMSTVRADITPYDNYNFRWYYNFTGANLFSANNISVVYLNGTRININQYCYSGGCYTIPDFLSDNNTYNSTDDILQVNRDYGYINNTVGNTTAEIISAENDPHWHANYTAYNTSWSKTVWNTTAEMQAAINSSHISPSLIEANNITSPNNDIGISANLNLMGNNLTAGNLNIADWNTGFYETGGVVKQYNPDYDEDFVFGSPQLADDGNTAHDARMWFDKSKGAFRAGKVTGTEWDDVNVGSYSFASGYITTASGMRSVAMGMGTSASATGSVAMGVSTTASGSYSVAMGGGTKADSYTSTALGIYNVGGGTANSWVATDPAFEIGIGTDDSNRANALTVYKNGTFNFHSSKLTDIGEITAGNTTLNPSGWTLRPASGDYIISLNIEFNQSGTVVGVLNYKNSTGIYRIEGVLDDYILPS